LSLGEFTALTAAGAMSFEDGLRVVRQRGRSCRKPATPRTAAWRRSSAWTRRRRARFVREAGVVLANLNCPGQLVISGETDKIAKAVELAKTKGAKRAIPLPVAGAYHSPLMASAQPKLQAELAE
jgi:[acyl-carrier-protein] S-malonyltransferase